VYYITYYIKIVVRVLQKCPAAKCNILTFTQNSLVLIPYLLNYSPHSLCLSWMKI